MYPQTDTADQDVPQRLTRGDAYAVREERREEGFYHRWRRPHTGTGAGVTLIRAEVSKRAWEGQGGSLYSGVVG